MRKSFLAFFFLATVVSVNAQENKTPAANRSTTQIIADLERDIPVLMQKADVPGLSAALIRKGKVVWSHSFGVANANTKVPVTNNTIFEAASLTKVTVAYAVLKLVDQGKLDLDVPLNKYLGTNYDVGDDPRLDKITARRVLSHTSGFPNWRFQGAEKLPINFEPGEKFGYSGEGFVYLSKAVEKITGQTFGDFLQKMVLDPLDMRNSAYGRREQFGQLAVHRHDLLGNLSFRNEDKEVNAAASLRTTATDYAKFVIAVLNHKGLKKKTWKQMLTPQIKVDEKAPFVFWGLGVGLDVSPDGTAFWHWGDQGDSKAFIAARVKQKDAIIYFANGANGLSFVQEILDDALGQRVGLGWLHYDRYDSPGRLLLKSIIAKGARESLADYEKNQKNDPKLTVSEGEINTIGYALMRMKKPDDAIEVFKQNTVDFPASWNVWDSLGEAYMNKGDKDLAIESYEKSIKLNPENQGGVEALKKLKQ